MYIVLLTIISFVLMIVFFLRFRERLKRESFSSWLLFCLLVCTTVFVISSFVVLWIAGIIAMVVSIALMIVTVGVVGSEIRKFESLIEKGEKVPLERN